MLEIFELSKLHIPSNKSSRILFLYTWGAATWKRLLVVLKIHYSEENSGGGLICSWKGYHFSYCIMLWQILACSLIDIIRFCREVTWKFAVSNCSKVHLWLFIVFILGKYLIKSLRWNFNGNFTWKTHKEYNCVKSPRGSYRSS